jgi:hypothetical protein
VKRWPGPSGALAWWSTTGLCLRQQARKNGEKYLSDGDGNSVWNATGVRWYLFHTTTCDGSRLEIVNGQMDLPVGGQ